MGIRASPRDSCGRSRRMARRTTRASPPSADAVARKRDAARKTLLLLLISRHRASRHPRSRWFCSRTLPALCANTQRARSPSASPRFRRGRPPRCLRCWRGSAPTRSPSGLKADAADDLDARVCARRSQGTPRGSARGRRGRGAPSARAAAPRAPRRWSSPSKKRAASRDLARARWRFVCSPRLWKHHRGSFPRLKGALEHAVTSSPEVPEVLIGAAAACAFCADEDPYAARRSWRGRCAPALSSPGAAGGGGAGLEAVASPRGGRAGLLRRAQGGGDAPSHLAARPEHPLVASRWVALMGGVGWTRRRGPRRRRRRWRRRSPRRARRTGRGRRRRLTAGCRTRTPTDGCQRARRRSTRSPSTIPRRFSSPRRAARTRRRVRPPRPAARWRSRCSASLRGSAALVDAGVACYRS